jgi:hypothetical protein
MGSDRTSTAGSVRILVSPDESQAWIEPPDSLPLELLLPGEAEVVEALKERGIWLTESVRERARKYVEALTQAQAAVARGAQTELPERFLVAEGRPATEARDGDFVWDEAFQQELQDWQGDAPVNYYSLNSIVTIETGTVIGRIIPPTNGVAGRDVYGQETAPRRKTGRPLQLGHGLRTADDDPEKVVTEAPGRLVREGDTLHMDELLKIRGDVDFEVGNVDACVDVHIYGDVKPNFSVKTTKSLTIKRAVEAAELQAGGDIHVRGGLFGHESGRRIQAGGSITASICDAALLEATGDVSISREIINSTIRTNGQLLIEHGSIIGGEVYARNGVKVKHAGSNAGVATRIAVGTDGAVLYRAQQIDKEIRQSQEQAEQIRTRVQPLLANLKRLTAAQREQATELMCKADEIETAGERRASERDEMLAEAQPAGKPGVDVSGTLHPGVVLVFGLREAAVKAPIKGPVRVEERQVKGATEIAVVNEVTASVMVLPSARVAVRRLRNAQFD